MNEAGDRRQEDRRAIEEVFIDVCTSIVVSMRQLARLKVHSGNLLSDSNMGPWFELQNGQRGIVILCRELQAKLFESV